MKQKKLSMKFVNSLLILTFLLGQVFRPIFCPISSDVSKDTLASRALTQINSGTVDNDSSKQTFTPNEKPLKFQPVTIRGTQLFRGGKPYVIRGVTLGFVPEGMTRMNAELNLHNAGEENIELMAEAGINTVRTYNAPTEDLLDAFAKHGIMVIVVFPNDDDRTVSNKVDIMHGNQPGGHLWYVEKHRKHPAILMWEYGNEYNLHKEWFDGSVENWYKILKEASTEVKEIDKLHPVSSAHGGFVPSWLVNSMTNVDIWGMNIYRGDSFRRPLWQSLFRQWARKNPGKPMYLSEWGNIRTTSTAKRLWAKLVQIINLKLSNEWRNNRTTPDQAQATTAKKLWAELDQAIDNKQSNGGTFMAWQDEDWKPGSAVERTLGIVKSGEVGQKRVPKATWHFFKGTWTKMLIFAASTLSVLGITIADIEDVSISSEQHRLIVTTEGKRYIFVPHDKIQEREIKLTEQNI